MLLKTPYLLFLGDAPDRLAAKVACGVHDWRPERCVGQLRLPGCAIDLGLPDLDVVEAARRGARTLVVGVANRGGTIAPAWRPTLEAALDAGLDIASGLHHRLLDQPGLAERARRSSRALVDVRVPQREYPIAVAEPRAGRRCLTVGTDCSIGKMYATLAIERTMRERAIPATFRATGQTGILVAGDGVPLDAVVADFMAGAVETITPAASDPAHWDLIEGQGSLFHPSFSGVTLALVHGGMPDALVLCHEPTRTHLRGLPGRPLPSLAELADVSLRLARVVSPDCRVAGIALNTAALDEDAARATLARIEDEMALPAVDPFRHGAGRLVDALEARAPPRERAGGGGSGEGSS